MPSPWARGDANHGFEGAAEGGLIGESRLLGDFTERAVCPREQQLRALDSLPDQGVVRRRCERLLERACEMAHQHAALASQRRQSDRAILMFPEQTECSPRFPGAQASPQT